MEAWLDLIKVLAVAIVGSAATYLLYIRQHKDNAPKLKVEKELTEMQKIQILLDEVQEERDKSRAYNKELETKINEYKSERELLIKNVSELNDRVAKLEQENQTKDEIIAQLERQLKAIEKKTGPLPDLPQDEK